MPRCPQRQAALSSGAWCVGASLIVAVVAACRQPDAPRPRDLRPCEALEDRMEATCQSVAARCTSVRACLGALPDLEDPSFPSSDHCDGAIIGRLAGVGPSDAPAVLAAIEQGSQTTVSVLLGMMPLTSEAFARSVAAHPSTAARVALATRTAPLPWPPGDYWFSIHEQALALVAARPSPPGTPEPFVLPPSPAERIEGAHRFGDDNARPLRGDACRAPGTARLSPWRFRWQGEERSVTPDERGWRPFISDTHHARGVWRTFECYNSPPEPAPLVVGRGVLLVHEDALAFAHDDVRQLQHAGRPLRFHRTPGGAYVVGTYLRRGQGMTVARYEQVVVWQWNATTERLTELVGLPGHEYAWSEVEDGTLLVGTTDHESRFVSAISAQGEASVPCW